MFGELEKYLESSTDTLLVIRHRSSAELVGFLGCREPDEELAAITVGRLALDKSAVARLLREALCSGPEARLLMTDAASSILQFLFEKGKVRLARAHAYKTNAPSIRIIETLGFQEVGASNKGKPEETLYFELSADQWRERQEGACPMETAAA
jgi:hypothetical protein